MIPLSFWNVPIRGDGFVDIMTSAEDFEVLAEYLDANGVVHSPLISNVAKIIAQQGKGAQSSPRKNDFDWFDYYDFETILNWMNATAQTHSDIASTQVIGYSTEGREILLLKISVDNDVSKPSIFIDGTFHAREWISPSVTMSIINELLTNRESHQDILTAFNFYFVPIVNPDGYEFTWTTDRLWRKTRSISNSSSCVGVDANRNFDYHFGDEIGASPDPCSILYHGPRAFSEPETEALRRFIMDNENVNWTLYISMHSYGQLFLVPWNWSLDAELPEDFPETMEIANAAVLAMEEKHGRVYRAGSGAELLYLFSGSSSDWAKGVGHFKHSVTLELRGGETGFLLPPEEIIPNCEEVWAGIHEILRRL